MESVTEVEADAKAEEETETKADASDTAMKTGRIRALLDTLTVAPETVDGYDRDLFKHWVEADRDGCDPAERCSSPKLSGPRRSAQATRCRTVDSSAATTARPPAAPVEASIPIISCRRRRHGSLGPETAPRISGNGTPTISDYDDARIAVSASSNRVKGARYPAEWLPLATVAHCWYAAAWINVKYLFDLAIYQAEEAALERALNGCDGSDLGACPEGRRSPSTSTEAGTKADGGDVSVDAPEGNCHPAYEPCLPDLPGGAVN